MGILELLYPCRCPVCHEIPRGKERICRECRKKLIEIKSPFCMKCGKQLSDPQREYCRDCQRYQHSFDRGRGAFVYEKTMKQSVAMLKYHNRREYAEVYGEEMARIFQKQLQIWKPQVILPIPIHAQKKVRRGFNQAEITAKKLGKLTGIPVDTKMLLRMENTTPQKELNPIERKRNLQKAFSFRENGIKYQRVLLVDDIYTTGATMDAAAKILRKNHIKFIFFLTICVGSDD